MLGFLVLTWERGSKESLGESPLSLVDSPNAMYPRESKHLRNFVGRERKGRREKEGAYFVYCCFQMNL